MNKLLLSFGLVCTLLLRGNEAPVPPKLCDRLGATCSSCTEVSFCQAQYSYPLKRSCKDPTPYCNGGECSDLPESAACIQDLNGFSCPLEDGSYPDGEDCKKYHICIGRKETTYECLLGDTVYWPQTLSCARLGGEGVECYAAACKNSQLKTVYEGDRSIYFLCTNGRPTLVQKCPPGTLFYEDKGRCDAACEHEGRIVDAKGNGSTFLECSQVHGRLEVQQRICPTNSHFDEEKLECVAGLRKKSTAAYVPVYFPNQPTTRPYSTPAPAWGH